MIEIKKDFKVNQEVIVEAGDKIEVLKERDEVDYYWTIQNIAMDYLIQGEKGGEAFAELLLKCINKMPYDENYMKGFTRVMKSNLL